MGRPRLYASDAERQRAFRARRRAKQQGPTISVGSRLDENRERLLAGIVAQYPAVRRLEDVMGPIPTPEEVDELDSFLRFRDQWRQPYQPEEEEMT